MDCKEPDKYTAVMVWDVPTAGYAKLFEAILPKHVLEGQDVTRYDPYNRSPLGTGPFMFKEWKTGEYVRLVRNPELLARLAVPVPGRDRLPVHPGRQHQAERDQVRRAAMGADHHDADQGGPGSAGL